MIRIREVSFVRLGYSGEDTYGEVEVHADEFDTPLIATFKQEEDGRLTLINVTEQRTDPGLDWFDNSLHDANPSAMERLFGAASDGELTRRAFEELVLGFEDTREQLEDAFYYGR